MIRHAFAPLWTYLRACHVIRAGYVEIGVEGGCILWDVR